VDGKRGNIVCRFVLLKLGAGLGMCPFQKFTFPIFYVFFLAIFLWLEFFFFFFFAMADDEDGGGGGVEDDAIESGRGYMARKRRRQNERLDGRAAALLRVLGSGGGSGASGVQVGLESQPGSPSLWRESALPHQPRVGAEHMPPPTVPPPLPPKTATAGETSYASVSVVVVIFFFFSFFFKSQLQADSD
jgi:hypothetical protein